MGVSTKYMLRPDGGRTKQIKILAEPGAQLDFIKDPMDFLAFFSGFGGGKTWAGASKAVYNSLVRYRGYNGLVIAPSFGDLESYVIPELLARFEQFGIKATHKKSSPPYIWFWLPVNRYENVMIKLHLRSAAHPESIAGFEVAWVWIDEACRIPKGKTPTQDVKTQSIGRMRGKGLKNRQLFITSTHEGEITWPNADWVEKPKPNHKYYVSSTFDNRYMRHYAEGLLTQYDKKLVRQYVYGEAVTIAGVLVYYAFEDDPWPTGNIDDTIGLNARMPVALSLDFNAAPGMHGTIGQYHPELDELWFLDEIHELGMNVPWLVVEYANRYKEKNIVTQLYGDSTAHRRDEALGETGWDWVARCMQDNDMPFADMTPNANPLREDRFISMNSAFKTHKGQIHIKIHPRCKKLIRDLKNVQRDERGRLDKTQEGLGMVHISDAASYWVHEVRPVNRTRVENFIYSKG